MRREESLLDLLSRELGCYVSDLRSIDDFTKEGISRIRKVILQIPEGACELAEWNETVLYIFGTSVKFKSVKEAKEYIYGRLLDKE